MIRNQNFRGMGSLLNGIIDADLSKSLSKPTTLEADDVDCPPVLLECLHHVLGHKEGRTAPKILACILSGGILLKLERASFVGLIRCTQQKSVHSQATESRHLCFPEIEILSVVRIATIKVVAQVSFRQFAQMIKTKKFVAEADEKNLTSLAGYRSLGGIRASIYNAMPVAGVEALRDFMVEFKNK